MKIPFLKHLAKLFNIQLAEKVQFAEELKSLNLNAEVNKGNVKIEIADNHGTIIVDKNVGMLGTVKDGADERLGAAIEKYLEANLAKRINELKSPNFIKVADMVVNTSASGAISSMEYIRGNKTYQDSFLDD